jgi:CHAT domain-containing protein
MSKWLNWLAAPVACAALLATPVVAQETQYDGYEQELADIRAQYAAAESPVDRAYGHAQIGLLLLGLNRYDDALAEIEAGKALLEPTPDFDVSRGELLYTEAFYFQRVQRYGECEVHMRDAQPIYVDNYGVDHPYTAMIESLLANCLQQQGLFAEAIELTRHTDAVFGAQGPEYGTQRANSLITLARALQSANLMQDAEDMMRLALIPAREMPEKHPIRLLVIHNLGMHLLGEGRALEASRLLQEAVQVATENPAISQAEQGSALTGLASAYLQLDMPDEALELALQGVELMEDSGVPLAVASNRGIATSAAMRGEKMELARELNAQVLATLAAEPDAGELRLAIAQMDAIPLLVSSGEFRQAGEFAASSAETLSRLRAVNHRQATAARIQLGWVLAQSGRAQEGLELARDAFRMATESLRELEYAQNRPLETLPYIVQYSQALETAYLAEDKDFAFEVMQAIIQSDASRAAFAVAAREAAADTELGNFLRERQEKGELVAAADSALLEAQAKDAPNQEELRQELALRRAALAQTDELLDLRFPEFRELIQPRPAAISEMIATLGKDEALLVVAESDRGLFTLAITDSGVAMNRAPIRREGLRGLVNSLRSGIDATLLAGEDAEFDLTAAAQLHDAIIGEDVRRLIRRKDNLLVATGDILSALPLTVLVSRQGERIANSRFLVEDKSISVVPSFAALAASRTGADEGGHLVAVGAPALAGEEQLAAASDYYAPGVLRSVRLGELAPLPGARAEMERVASLLSDQGEPVILQGAAANEPAVKALDLKDVGVLLFATHGLVAGSFDGNSEPALVLTPPEVESAEDDGLLTASEAALLDIGADWVILSACDTAAGGRPSAAGYTGLARGFLFAGAKRVVASHWPVRDDISARISAGLVEASRDGSNPGEALREAILEVKKDEVHPAHWAPFMVVAR